MFFSILPQALALLAAVGPLASALPIEQRDPSQAQRRDAADSQEGSQEGLQNLRATLNSRSESGPVISENFPDPGLINIDDQWYAFATRTKGSTIHIQVATSTDFDTWSILTDTDGSQYDALPTLPAWVNNTGLMTWNTWAPSVKQLVGRVANLRSFD